MADLSKLIDVAFELDREQIARGGISIVHLVTRIRAAGADGGRRPPLAIVLALDVSSSMSGAPLQHAVRSAERIAELLEPLDRLGLVAFSEDAFDVAPLCPAGDAMRRRLSRSLRLLHTRSCTNVESGLRAAYRMLGARTTRDRPIALLLSDGQPNVGAQRPADLASIAQASEISTATLGYGRHHDDRVLAAIAEGGRGRYAFVPDPELCHLEMARALGAQGDAVIEAVEVRVAALGDARVNWVTGPSVRSTGQEAIVGLPDLGAGAQAVVAAQLVVGPGTRSGRLAVADVAVSFQAAGSGALGSLCRRVEVAVDEVEAAGRPDVLRAALLAEAGLRRREACALGDTGRFDEAVTLLSALGERIRAAPGASQDAELSEALEQIVDDADLMRRRPDQAVYAAFRHGQRDLDPARGAASPYARALLDDAAGEVPRAELVVVDGPMRDAVFRLRANNHLGRTPSSEICLPDGSVSRLHARIAAAQGTFWLVDLGSTNTTRVNGEPVAKHKLVDGDHIELGVWRLRYVER